ncbi:hypothetical protein BACPLE_02023 [Phocaeicola plebeius DSM 17135]|uniref:Uncharacterized protein n=1 Tax=Phocaeicola plebeius (strain DSM 17135 / JCM 12973 / CCUG 54634 / M2) TaxID=484018 RepID=B5CZ66_PHOPM|nr:hypothetical protein BACPLE_02023 [Phocaeicola plebeius DSM 17135]
MNINKTDYLFRSYGRIHVFLHAEKNIMNYSDTSGSLGIWLIFALVYEKEVCFFAVCYFDKLCFFFNQSLGGNF